MVYKFLSFFSYKVLLLLLSDTAILEQFYITKMCVLPESITEHLVLQINYSKQIYLTNLNIVYFYTNELL